MASLPRDSQRLQPTRLDVTHRSRKCVEHHLRLASQQRRVWTGRVVGDELIARSRDRSKPLAEQVLESAYSDRSNSNASGLGLGQLHELCCIIGWQAWIGDDHTTQGSELADGFEIC